MSRLTLSVLSKLAVLFGAAYAAFVLVNHLVNDTHFARLLSDHLHSCEAGPVEFVAIVVALSTTIFSLLMTWIRWMKPTARHFDSYLDESTKAHRIARYQSRVDAGF